MDIYLKYQKSEYDYFSNIMLCEKTRNITYKEKVNKTENNYLFLEHCLSNKRLNKRNLSIQKS